MCATSTLANERRTRSPSWSGRWRVSRSTQQRYPRIGDAALDVWSLRSAAAALFVGAAAMRHARDIVLSAAAACIAVIVACGTNGTPFSNGAQSGIDSGIAATTMGTDAGWSEAGVIGLGPPSDSGVDAGAGSIDAGCAASGCSGGQICEMGACVCPIYQSFCNGQCIPTSNDANNCG